MALRLWNTLTDRKEEFVPAQPGKFSLYVCGITVYDLLHLGHARFLVAFDVAVRYLRWAGWDVTYVRNWTDVDDKIIRRAIERSEEPRALAERFIDEARRDMRSISVLAADFEPKATEHIPEMVELISSLVEKGHAYVSGGDVYFAVRSFPQYGKLSKRHIDDLLVGARVEPGERKRDPLDFALWKGTKPGEPETVSWDSPWGRGRPGWHIECSAMSEKYLGPAFDAHGGGKDLVFPHHENEIAQSEAATGQPLARCWLHNGFITVDAVKMSKSLGNFRTLRDLLGQWDGEALRTMLLGTQYRHPINFAEAAIADADQRVEYFYETQAKAEAWLQTKKARSGGKLLEEHAGAFREAMDDDFNTAEALARVERVHGLLNARIDAKGKPDEVVDLLHTARSLAGVLGLSGRRASDAILERRALAAARKGIDPAWVEERISARLAARKKKDFAQADAIRQEVLDRGVELRDAVRGTDWRVLG